MTMGFVFVENISAQSSRKYFRSSKLVFCFFLSQKPTKPSQNLPYRCINPILQITNYEIHRLSYTRFMQGYITFFLNLTVLFCRQVHGGMTCLSQFKQL